MSKEQVLPKRLATAAHDRVNRNAAEGGAEVAFVLPER